WNFSDDSSNQDLNTRPSITSRTQVKPKSTAHRATDEITLTVVPAAVRHAWAMIGPTLLKLYRALAYESVRIDGISSIVSPRSTDKNSDRNILE
ncbi:unnamed protein product, partial [Rotaria sp. Silwood2]